MNILAIYAHPDDAEFLASGSMAKWAKQGHEVYAIVATDGGMGTKTPGQSLEQVAAKRRGELTKAMEVIGGHPPLEQNGASTRITEWGSVTRPEEGPLCPTW